MITNVHTKEAECQTLLQCSPHILEGDELANVQSDAASQTLVSLAPQSSNSALYPLLSFTKPEEIQRNAIKECLLPRRKRLQFILPAGHIDSMRVSLEQMHNLDLEEDPIDNERRDSNESEDTCAELDAFIAEREQQKAVQAAQANPEDPCQVLEGLIAESEQEKMKRKEEIAGPSSQNSKRRDSTESEDSSRRVDPLNTEREQEKKKEVSHRGQRSSTDQTSSNQNSKRRDAVSQRSPRSSIERNDLPQDNVRNSIDRTDQPILSILKSPADDDPSRKRRRRIRTNDAECQTNLMVAPHILRPSEAAVVSCELSVQTSVTCHPECSVTDILPKLKSCLVHEGRQAEPTSGDNKNNANVLDLLKGLINEVEYSHMHMFDPSYRPPTVPLALLDPSMVDRTESFRTTPSKPRIVKLIDPKQVQIQPENILIPTSVQPEKKTESNDIPCRIRITRIDSEPTVVQLEIKTEPSDIPCRIKIEPTASEPIVGQSDINIESSDIPCKIKIEPIDSAPTTVQIEIKTEPSNVPCRLKIEPIDSAPAVVQPAIKSEPNDIPGRIKSEPVDSEPAVVQPVIKSEPIDSEPTGVQPAIKTEPSEFKQEPIDYTPSLVKPEEEDAKYGIVEREPSIAARFGSVSKPESDTSGDDIVFEGQWVHSNIVAQVDITDDDDQPSTLQDAVTEIIGLVIDGLVKDPQADAKSPTVPSAAKVPTVPSAAKGPTVPLAVKPHEMPNCNINFYLNNCIAQSSETNDRVMKTCFQINIFPCNQNQQPFTTVSETNESANVNLHEVAFTCNSDGTKNNMYDSNKPVKEQQQNLNVMKCCCANRMNQVPSQGKVGLGAEPAESRSVLSQQPSQCRAVLYQKSLESGVLDENDAIEKSQTATSLSRPTLSTVTHKNPYRCRCAESLKSLDDESETELEIPTKPSQQEVEYLTNVCDNVVLQNCRYCFTPQNIPTEKVSLKGILSKKDLITGNKAKQDVHAKSSQNYIKQNISYAALTDDSAPMMVASQKSKTEKIVSTTTSVVIIDKGAPVVQFLSPNIVESEISSVEPCLAPCADLREDSAPMIVECTVSTPGKITSTTTSVIITDKGVQVSSPSVVESYESCSVSSQEIAESQESKTGKITTTTSLIMTDKDPSVVQVSTPNVVEGPCTAPCAAVQQDPAPQIVESKVSITESCRAPCATLQQDSSLTVVQSEASTLGRIMSTTTSVIISDKGKSAVQVSSVSAVISAKPSKTSVPPSPESQEFSRPVISCDCETRNTNAKTTNNKLLYNNSCTLCYVESYITEGYGPTLCNEKDKSNLASASKLAASQTHNLQKDEKSLSRVEIQISSMETRKPEIDATEKEVHQVPSSLKQPAGTNTSLTCVNSQAYIREFINELPEKERNELACISDAEISWSKILLPSDVKIEAIDKPMVIEEVAEEKEMVEVLSSKSLPCICKSGYVLPIRVHRNIDLLCRNVDPSPGEVACCESTSTIVLLLPRSSHFTSTTTFPVEPENPPSLAKISKELIEKLEIKKSLIVQKPKTVESKKSVTFGINAPRTDSCKNDREKFTSKSVHVIRCCKKKSSAKYTIKHRELPTIPAVRRQLHGQLTLPKSKSHEKIKSSTSKISTRSTSKSSTSKLGKLSTSKLPAHNKISTRSTTKLAKPTSKTTITIKDSKLKCEPCDRPLEMKLSRSTASVKIKPDPVFIAMAACQTEFQPIKQALHTVQEKLKNLHMPELDSIFNKVPAYTDTLHLDGKEKYKISVDYKLDQSNQRTFKYNSLHSNEMNSQYKSFETTECRTIPSTLAYPRTSNVFAPHTAMHHQQQDVYHSSVPSARDQYQNYYSLPDSEWSDYENKLDFPSPPESISSKYSIHRPVKHDRNSKDRSKTKHVSSRTGCDKDFTYLPSTSEKRERRKKDKPKDNRVSSRTNCDADFRASERHDKKKKDRSKHVAHVHKYDEDFRSIPRNTYMQDQCTCFHDHSSNYRNDYGRSAGHSRIGSNHKDRCYCSKPRKNVSKIHMKKKHGHSKSKTNLKTSDSQCPFIDALTALFMPAEKYGKTPRLTNKDIENLRVHLQFYSNSDKHKHS